MTKKTNNTNLIEKEKNIVKELLNSKLGIDAPKIEFNDVGWTSRVYIINQGEIVFKFPRFEKIKEEYKLEIPAYKKAFEVKGDDVLIPEVIFENKNYDYMGYRGIQGRSLNEVIEELSPETKKKLGKSLGSFLKRFHALEIEGAHTISSDTEFEELRKKFEEIKEKLDVFFSEIEIEKIKGFFLQEYPKQYSELNFDPVLCHGDLGYWNIIYNKKDQSIGLIDFGDVGFYDKSKDFAGMTDEILLDSVLMEYGWDENIKKKARLRIKSILVSDLFYYFEQGNKAKIEESIKDIRNIILV